MPVGEVFLYGLFAAIAVGAIIATALIFRRSA